MGASDVNQGNSSPEAGTGRGSAFQQQLDWARKRVLQLDEETRQVRAEVKRERHLRQAAEAEARWLSALLLRAERLVRSMEFGLQGMRRSVSMQLGYLITQSVRSPKQLVRLPIAAVRLLRHARRPNSDRPSVPVPQEWYPTALRRELACFYAQVGERDASKNVRSSVAPARMASGGAAKWLPGLRELPCDLTEVRIAAVMDEFTFSAYRDCCEVTQLTPEAWRVEIEAVKPHLVFIESAWDGKDRKWQRKVSQTSKELRELCEYARAHAVPVIFWSKEDPVHFKAFLSTARLADVVFTTDIDCIKHYKEELGHDRVYLLPFATQPLAHNPIEQYERKQAFCFAGSYYLRYPVRQRDFAALIDAASRVGEVDIYDRNFGKDHPNYIFPESYKKYILGGLSFDEIDIAYKGYQFGININTVKNSQSMFARRVFDLLGSNTTTVSNYSRGLRLMFGDLVISSDSADQLVQALRPLINDPVYRRKHRLAGLRKIMREHTYQHRLAYLLSKISRTPAQALGPELTVIGLVGSETQLARLLSAFRRQSWHRKRLLVVTEPDFRPRKTPVAGDIQVLSALQAARRNVDEVAAEGYIAGFHHDDYYGVNYLTDLALATTYAFAEAVGKVSHFSMCDATPVIQHPDAQYTRGGRLLKRRGIISAGAVGRVNVRDWLADIDGGDLGDDVLAIDEFNYCEGAGERNNLIEVDDLPNVDSGISINALLTLAEGIEASSESKVDGASRNESAGLPGIEASELLERFGTPATSRVRLAVEGGTLVITSTVPSDSKAYLYLAGSFTPEELNLSDIARMQLVVDRGDGLELVLVYKDQRNEKISHSILKSGVNVTVSVPLGTDRVEVGFRISKPGTFHVARLVFDHVPLSVEAMVTRRRHLVLAKNYPSYEDLYKHAFVHRRVLEYRRQDADVDVFRMGSAGLSFYEFDGVDVAYGQADHLRSMLRSGNYESVLVHFLDERMWEVLQEFVDRLRIFVWAHGAEIQSASRREFDHVDEETRTRAVALGDRRMRFWRSLFSHMHPNLTMIFVSEWFANDVMEDVGVRLPEGAYKIIHNFIDTELFTYVPKPPSQRCKILSIRPYESAKYANDLSVAAVLALREKPFFDELEFNFVGDGRLFEETLAPLSGLKNVKVHRGFLSQVQIAELHKSYGVFLNPTRMDAQGVSRDEAMSSGLVPISTRCTAIPEFVDAGCGFLAEPEDARGLAAAIERLYHDPELFHTLSEAAARRVREQSGVEATIAREVALFRDAEGLGRLRDGDTE